MIAKIVKGSNFKGVVSYILDKEKDAKILVCDGLFAENKETIAGSFEAQARMNPRVTKPVGHIALAFSKEDEHRLTDCAMAGIALEYLKKMGITDTQILIVRHFDKEHPHVHIAFNRIANDGRTISDRNERIRSTRICKELTRKYGLYFADGKEQVKRHRLKEPDKTQYELYSILKSEVSRCGNWRQLMANLEKQGVDTTNLTVFIFKNIMSDFWTSVYKAWYILHNKIFRFSLKNEVRSIIKLLGFRETPAGWPRWPTRIPASASWTTR